MIQGEGAADKAATGESSGPTPATDLRLCPRLGSGPDMQDVVPFTLIRALALCLSGVVTNRCHDPSGPLVILCGKGCLVAGIELACAVRSLGDGGDLDVVHVDAGGRVAVRAGGDG